MESAAQIYKADLRGRSETEIFRRLATFNFDQYKGEAREPFGLLNAFNDETLGPGHTIFRHIDFDTDILILPLVGAVDFRDSFGRQSTINTGEIGIFSGGNGNGYQLTNPYEDELVNYLQIWLGAKAQLKTGSSQHPVEFIHRNTLLPLLDQSETIHSGAKISIGLFDGRRDSTYRLSDPANGLFAFVISGAFEFENRLVESRDGLALTGVVEAEFEALSENAMLLVLEIPLI